jgi:DNA-binding response OmpR family regulator
MAKPHHQRTILIADDEPEILDLMRMMLEWENYAVVETTDGEQCLEQARAIKPDLILSDVRMPKLTGLEVLEHLKADPELSGIPVIMLSVVTTLPQVRTALENGAIAYLPKPFEMREMARLVNRVLSRDAGGREVIRQQALKDFGLEK